MRPRRRHAWLGAGLTAALATLYLALPGGAGEPAAAIAPAMAEVSPAAAVRPDRDPRPMPDLGALRLHGLTATGAIIASSTGQRLVRLGREVVPGVTLREIRQHHAVLASADGLFELGFLGIERASTPRSPSGASEPRGPAATPQRRTEVLQYRLGFEPRRSEGRITGFTVRPGAEMPLLQRAGLRPGDVLVGVNGQTFDSEERVNELAAEIAGAYTAEFEFERQGRRMRTSLEINPRP